LSTSRTDSLTAGGAAPLEALNGGFQLGFAAGAIAALAAAIVGGVLLRPKPMAAAEPDDVPDEELLPAALRLDCVRGPLPFGR
jgi:hypothetical protein